MVSFGISGTALDWFLSDEQGGVCATIVRFGVPQALGPLCSSYIHYRFDQPHRGIWPHLYADDTQMP